MQWYESYQGKTIVNIVYSVGASVVIIGALFKILHWPGASYVLMVGMFTEAFLFIIGALDKPHPEFHWDNVFPQLLGYGTDPKLLAEKAQQPRPTLLSGGTAEAAPAQTAAGVSVPALSAEDTKALTNSLSELAKTSAHLATAGAAAEKFAATADKLTASYDAIDANMQAAVAGAKAYEENITAVGAKMGSINSLYELQMKNIQAQNDAIVAMAKDVTNMQSAANEAAKSSVAYSEGAKKLSEQVASLNAVYGNMLNALA